MLKYPRTFKKPKERGEQMKKRSVLDTIKRDQFIWVFTKAKEIVKNNGYRYFQGMHYANNILIIDISEQSSILIDFSDNTIQLIDNSDFSSKNYDSQNEITILSWLITDFIEITKEKTGHSPLLNFFGTLKGMHKDRSKDNINTIDLFFKAELWYYKSLLSSNIAIYCFKKDGQYQFDLPDNKVLHVYISRIYMTDEGIYFIQKIRNGISFYVNEVNCKQDILTACKYLTSNTNLLKPK